MLVRRIPALLTAFAVAASGLTVAAMPAHAAATLTLDSYGPTEWAAGSSNETTITWSDTYVKSGYATTQTLSVEIEWDWTVGAAFTAGSENATFSGNTFTCPSTGITFSGLGKVGSSTTTGQPPQCVYRAANSGNPVRVVELKDGSLSSDYFTYAGTSPITATVPQGLVIASTTPRSNYRWTLTSFIGSNSTPNPNYAYLAFSVPASGGVGVTVPVITINIDGNGGECRTSAVTGFQGSWANAPDSGCIKPGYIFRGFNTKADGSGLAIGLGGNLNLTGDNTLYAIYEQFRTAGAPLDVIATPGRNTISLSWKPPVDEGPSGISNYLATATPSGRVCITRRTDANMLACEIKMPATNTKYTFKVQALNPAGWGPYSAESSPVSPYDAVILEASRTKNGLFQGLGSTLRFDGRAPGFAQGTAVTPQWRVGPSGNWVSETKDRPKVDANGRVSWSKKLGLFLNKKWVEIRFIVGNIESNEFRLDVGSSAGKLTAPRNVSVKSTINGLEVSWKAPAFDGGSKVTSYTVTSSDGLGYECKVAAPSTECTMRARAFNFNPQQTYTFSVVAKNADGVSEAGTATWKGKLYNLRITSGTRGPNAGKESIGINAFSSGFKVGEKFTVETRVGKNGTWTKQSKAMVLEEDGRGSWERIIGPDLASQDVYVRIVTSRGISNELRLRPLR